MAQRRVTAIPATISRYTATPINNPRKRRVAGYARVSTDHKDQATSYEAQVDYYTTYIKRRYRLDGDIRRRASALRCFSSARENFL